MRGERVNSPLGRPEVLVHLIDQTIDEIFAALHGTPSSTLSTPVAASQLSGHCHCGHNPLLAYFIAGEQALLEEMIHLQAENPAATRDEHATDLVDLYTVVRQLARQEVEAFCSLCQHALGAAEATVTVAKKTTRV